MASFSKKCLVLTPYIRKWRVKPCNSEAKSTSGKCPEKVHFFLMGRGNLRKNAA